MEEEQTYRRNNQLVYKKSKKLYEILNEIKVLEVTKLRWKHLNIAPTSWLEEKMLQDQAQFTKKNIKKCEIFEREINGQDD